MYYNIDDCDERRSSLPYIGDLLFNRVLLVYNFWEPLHFLEQGYGFQTWELSPEFAFRSWAYILLHYRDLPPRVGQLLASGDKVRFLFYYSELLVNWVLTASSVFCCSQHLPGNNLSFRRSHVLPNYSRQNQWSRTALLFLHDVFQCWDVECFYMLVARCVHGCMKSDLHQLSCHLHSPCMPLLWPFLTRLRRVAHKTTIEP